MLAHSPEIIASEFVDAALLTPAILVLSNYLTSIILFFFRVSFSDDEISVFAAVNIRWQVIIYTIISFLFYMILPFFTVIKDFTLKSD